MYQAVVGKDASGYFVLCGYLPEKDRAAEIRRHNGEAKVILEVHDKDLDGALEKAEKEARSRGIARVFDLY